MPDYEVLLEEAMHEFPTLPYGLVEALEARFPNHCPTPDQTERQIWMNAGAVSVVTLLRQALNEQSSTSLK